MPRMPREIFTPEWQAAGEAAVSPAMPATVSLFRIEGSVYVPEDNEYVDDIDVLYGGRARIQPLRSSRFEPAPMDSAYWQTVLISIPITLVKDVDFRPGDQARVLDAELNPSIERYQYNINEIIDSSNPFERTLLCAVTLEATTE